MNQTEFNEMWIKIAKENPEFVFEMVENPFKTEPDVDVTISTKEGYKLAWVNFSHFLYVPEKPVENLSMLVTKFNYEYIGYDTRATKEEIEKINKIRNILKGEN